MRTFYLSTSGAQYSEHNDDANVIQLEAETLQFPTQFVGYVSKPMILVADVYDNAFKNDNATNDQTHIVELGSEVEVRVGNATAPVALSAAVSPKEEIDVKVILLYQTPDGIPVELLEKSRDDMAIAHEIFTQA